MATYLGTIREYSQGGETFAIIQRMPGWPADLIGGATREEKAKKLMCVRFNSATKVKVSREFTDSLVTAEAALTSELGTVGKASRPFRFTGGDFQQQLNDWQNVREK